MEGRKARISSQYILRVLARYRIWSALGEANATRNRAQFPYSNAKTIQTRGIRVCHFQFQCHGLNADIQTGCKGTSQALRDLFSRLIRTKQQSDGISSMQLPHLHSYISLPSLSNLRMGLPYL